MFGVWYDQSNAIDFVKTQNGDVYGGEVLRNIWTSIKLTRNNDHYMIFLNGNLVAEENNNWSEDLYNTIGAWMVNDSQPDNRETWSGKMAQLIIYNGADTLVYYKFNNGTGNILLDHSGNENHGTIHGATWVERE